MQNNIMAKNVGEAITKSFRVFNLASSAAVFVLIMILRMIIDAKLECYMDMFMQSA